MTRRLLVATSNAGKAREFRDLLPADVEVLTLKDLGLPSPVEDGDTFEANARIKALAAARVSGLLTLADDSGIVVDALDGAPGIHSAYYAGQGAGDAANRARLLADLAAFPGADRAARFVAVLVLAGPDGVIAEARGEVAGSVAISERGDGGFGYDPLFTLPDGRTIAEIPAAEKNEVSHRAIAARQMLPALLSALAASDPRP
jgi:XTP/dITP diphosphohydrolase